MGAKNVQSAITLGALGVALAHILFPELEIDGVSVSLLAIAVIPWLGPLFKAIELPGGLKVEYQDLLNAEERAADAGLLAPAAAAGTERRHAYAFEVVAGNDPNLALAGLRIELESRMRDIATSKNIPSQNRSAGQLIRELGSRGALSPNEISVIEDLLPLLNRAAHGAQVDERASRWALDIGIRILAALEERQGETTVPQLLEQWRGRDGAGVAEIGTELSKAFVKSPLSFLRAMKGDAESYSTWIEGLGHHTFTIFESRSEIEDELWAAYYEKLKSLMHNAATEALSSDCKQEAQRLIDGLSKVQIRRIW